MLFLKVLKQKNNLIVQKILLLLLAVLLIGGGFFASSAQAASPNCGNARVDNSDRVCQLSDIKLTTDILINGQKTNFLRVGNETSSKITFTVQLTMQSPADLLPGKDEIYFPGTNNNVNFGGFGATLTPKDTSGTCGSVTVSSLFGAGTNASYEKCQSQGDVSGTSVGKYDDISGVSGTFKAGAVVYTHTFTISQADFAKFGLTSVNNGTDVSSGINQFYVAPNIRMNYLLTTDWSTATKAGQGIYVQLFPTDAAATAATGQPVPGGVPGYGSNTGGAQDVNGSDSFGLLGLVNKLIAFLLQIVTEFLYFVFYWLVAPTIQAMLSIHTYTDTFANVIYPGWEIVRNVSNIFFIIALVSIAMGTLFRVESYNYRHLLVQLIIAALLVNFSLVICQAILAVADTIQNQFLPNNVEVVRSLARDLMVSNIRDVIYNTNFAQFGTFSQTVSLLFYVSMSIASFGVFAAICVYLVIRIVWLWILMMVSPIAYVAGVIPSTAGYKGQWWSQFLKYAFFTPIMAFFLNMAALISTNQASVLRTVTSADFADSTAPTLSAFVFKVASNILLLVFLFIALQVAEQFGIYGASAISETAKKGWFAPFKAAKWAGSRTFEGIQNTFGVTLSPKQLAEDWKHYSEEKKAERLRNRQAGKGRFNIQGRTGIPTASPHDLFETYANWKGVNRVLRSKFGLRGFKHAAQEAENVRDKKDIMTDTERADLTKEQAKLADELLFAKSDLATGERAQKISADVKAKIDELVASKKQLEDSAKDLTAKGLTQEAAVKTAEAAQKDAIISSLVDYKNDLDNQVDRVKKGFQSQVNMLSAGTKLKNATAAKEVKDNIYDNATLQSQLANTQTSNANKLANDDALRKKHNITTFSSKDKKDAIQEFKDLEDHAMHLKRPEMFHSRAARNEAEQTEAKKIQDVDEAEELVRYLKDAIHEDNTARVGAILKKLAKDSNFNEALGAMGYEASFDGMKQFFDKELGEKLHMSENHKLQLATEVGYVNEDVNWWDLARVTSMGTKGLRWSTKEEHHGAITAEMRKRYPQRQARDFSRISFVTQKFDPVDGWVSTGLHESGIKILRDFGADSQTKTQFRQNIRANTAIAITKAPHWESDLKDAGVDGEIIQYLKEKSKQADRG